MPSHFPGPEQDGPCDVKLSASIEIMLALLQSPNILLDKDFQAKVADVGLARTTNSLAILSDDNLRGTYDWVSKLNDAPACKQISRL